MDYSQTRHDDYRYKRIYHNKLVLFLLWFFVFFTLLVEVLMCYSKIAYEESIFLPVIILTPVLVGLIFLLNLFYKVRIENYEDKIVVYGKRLGKIKLINSFKVGYVINFDNIISIDLIPIKYFNLVLTYQICIKTLNSSESIYLNSFSNLDRLFIEIRAQRYRRNKERYGKK